MIQPRQDITWVKADDGHMSPFDTERLAASIERVAIAAGEGETCLAESIAAAIQLYAGDVVNNQVVTVDEISEMVEAVLSMLGHDEIARAYALARRSSAIRLDAMAASAGAAFELEFYRRLDAELRTAANDRIRMLRVSGVRDCVLLLRGRRRWGTSCQHLADDIVAYVHARVARTQPGRSDTLQLAVLD